MKKYILIIFSLILLSNTGLDAQYWKRCENVSPKEFLDTYWLDVFFLPTNPQLGWICGRKGRVIRTTDGGASWRGVTVPTGEHLESIHFPSASVGYTSGPFGINKTTDGGATWVDITPNPASDSTKWGCFFLTENEGMVVGDGCGITEQYFWKTDDGGATWTVFATDDGNTALTDIILYPDGTGYAVSSARLWSTTDGGATWAVLAATGSQTWHEEITKKGSSFLLPGSGISCSGGGNGGSIRFTHDMGTSWNTYNTKWPLYGTFLMNSRVGWACGLFGQIFQTKNGGRHWVKRNCGAKEHLDDIWFISEKKAWTVGEKIILTLSAPELIASKDSLVFGNLCLPSTRVDTVYVNNKSFYESVGSWEVLGKDAPHFKIKTIAPAFTYEECETLEVIVEFAPTSLGKKKAELIFLADNNRREVIYLSGSVTTPTVLLDKTLLEINPAPCNVKSFGVIKWGSLSSLDFIKKLEEPAENSKDISKEFSYPFNIPLGGIDMRFSVNPQDTGWVSATYRAIVFPCEKDTTIEVRAYGVSPIITTKTYKNTLTCDSTIEIKIPVENTGNADLKISKLFLQLNVAEFKIIGWTSGKSLPISIPDNAVDTVIVQFKSSQIGTFSDNLIIENNDSTKVRGHMNPALVAMRILYSSPIVDISKKRVDFGTVCINSNNTREIEISNRGDLPTDIQWKLLDDIFSISATPLLTLPADSKKVIKIDFLPKTVGFFEDTLLVISKRCGDTSKILIRGRSAEAKLEAENNIVLNCQTNAPFSKIFTVKSLSSIDLKITEIKLVPNPANIDFSFTPALPEDIISNEEINFNLEFLCKTNLFYSGKLCVKAEGLCDVELCSDIVIKSVDGDIRVHADSIHFDDYTCDLPDETRTITITNHSSQLDKITQLKLDPNLSSYFTLEHAHKLPLSLAPNASETLNIRYKPLVEGFHNGELIIKSVLMKNAEVRVKVSGSYKTTKTDIDILTHDYGIFEPCEDKKEISITFSNTGTLEEHLTVKMPAQLKGIDWQHTGDIVIAPNDKKIIKISFDPSVFTVAQIINSKIDFTSTVCSFAKSLNIQATIIDPELIIEPQNIDFESVWIGTSKTEEVRIINRSGYDKTIHKKDIVPNTSAVEIIGLNLSHLLKDGDTLKLGIKFTANQRGSFNHAITFLNKRACDKENTFGISATVPLEHYIINLHIADYNIQIGDEEDIEIKLVDAVKNFRPSKLFLELEFEKYLLYPQALILKSKGTERALDFTRLDNTLIAEVSDVQDILETEGTIFRLKVNSLIHMPNTTNVEITKFAFDTDKSYEVNSNTGHVRVIGFCRPMAEFKVKYIPTTHIKLAKEVVSGHYITFEVDTEQRQTLAFTIYNVSGKVMAASSQIINSSCEVNINTNDLSSGLYFVKTSTIYGQERTFKVLIIK